MTKKDTPKYIICFGNSLTAGYGVDISESYPSQLQKRIDSAGLNYKVINAGLSGETTAGGVSRVQWVLKTKPDMLILELGANDGLRGIDPADSRKNLQAIIDTIKTKYPQCKLVLAGMKLPPSMGEKYNKKFESIFPELAEKNHLLLIPFFLEGVGGEADLNQGDGIHPTAKGYTRVVGNIWKVIEKEL